MSKPTLKARLFARAKRLKTDLPAVYLALRDPRTLWPAKTLALLTVAYAFSPIDLIPDFIPILGSLDDLLILPLMIAATLALVPTDVLADCRARAENLWAKGKPVKWYCAIPIVLAWILTLWLLSRAFWH